ncbi:hypothetical protein K438DRAFT_434939 [Mycena galopus ATCC 62051]|nr:hypothetical protein K438DRAFT_434939 [Mycena galopus ATCC 62051]
MLVRTVRNLCLTSTFSLPSLANHLRHSRQLVQTCQQLEHFDIGHRLPKHSEPFKIYSCFQFRPSGHWRYRIRSI